MITFEEVGSMLDSIAEEIPKDFYNELNGGIVLLPDAKMHPESHVGTPLYILGEYHNDRKGYGGLGRYICIYYGSFVRIYSNLLSEHLRKELKRVLVHEFTHHIESLAKEHGLEYKDMRRLNEYRQKVDGEHE